MSSTKKKNSVWCLEHFETRKRRNIKLITGNFPENLAAAVEWEQKLSQVLHFSPFIVSFYDKEDGCSVDTTSGLAFVKHARLSKEKLVVSYTVFSFCRFG